jgi:hypothetical protein
MTVESTVSHASTGPDGFAIAADDPMHYAVFGRYFRIVPDGLMAELKFGPTYVSVGPSFSSVETEVLT